MMMRAWQVDHPGPLSSGPLVATKLEVPQPARGELLVRVLACGVCRTDLHVAEGDLPMRRREIVPGHEVVGEVVEVAYGAGPAFAVGDRVGIAWLRSTCGTCSYCVRGSENLCWSSRYTGWDEDGGYAEYAVVPADFAYHLPTGYTDVELAPLLCAGIIGHRALQRSCCPSRGRLGIYGFGASAHLTLQMALARGIDVHVMTRSVEAQNLALELGAASASGASDAPPDLLDSAILFAPAGELVLPALQALDAGGTLAIAGIHLSQIPPLDYHRHLFRERQVRSVTANTREDGREFLLFAREHKFTVAATPYPLDRADRALEDLAADRVRGAAVLVP